MIKKDKKINAKGETKTQIRVVEGYRPGPGMPPKQRTIRDFGYLEDQDDPVAFMKMVEEFNANYKKMNVPLRIETASTVKMYSKENRRYNYGYKFLESVYNLLDIDSFIKDYEETNKFRGKYSLCETFKFLVLLRILSPDSKRASSQKRDCLYNMELDFTLPDIYRSLDHFGQFEAKLQRYLNERVKKIIGRDLSYAFYDVTNYYFDIDFPNGEEDLRQKGVSKEHRTSPIVAMGLFIDSNGLPVSMSMFPGNTSDSLTLQPTMKDVKETYGLGRIVIVADKGINTSDNINQIVNNNDGFVFSQILKGKKGKRYHDKLFDENGWISNSDDSYRYKIFIEEYEGKDKQGNKVIRKRKVLLYWSKMEAEMEKRKREEKLLKAERLVKNNAYGIKKGVEAYTKENIVDKNTGEIMENTTTLRSVDYEKAEQDELFDGYFCIITSELEYDERKIREVYHGLWRIEQSFRILKSDLYARPVWVRTNEHIRGHFLICFVSLLIIRIIQKYMGDKALSAERISRALNAATCRVLQGGIVQLDDVGGALTFKKVKNMNGEIVDTLTFSEDDEIALDYKLIQEVFGTDCYNVYIRQEEFNKFLKSISLA